MDEFEANTSKYIGEYGSYRQIDETHHFINSVSVVTQSGIVCVDRSYIIVQSLNGYVDTYLAKLKAVHNWEEWVLLEFESALSEHIFLINLVEDYDNFYTDWKILDIQYYVNEIQDFEIKKFCKDCSKV